LKSMRFSDRSRGFRRTLCSLVSHVVATDWATRARPKPLRDAGSVKDVAAVPKTRADQNRLLTHRTVRIRAVHVVLKCRKELSRRRNNRNILKSSRRDVPLHRSSRDGHNIPLRRDRFEDGTHEPENIVGHPSSVSNDSRPKRVRKGNSQTKKNSVGLEEVADNRDDCGRRG